MKTDNIIEHPNFRYLKDMNEQMQSSDSVKFHLFLKNDYDILVHISEFVDVFYEKKDISFLFAQNIIQAVLFEADFYLYKFQFDILIYKLQNEKNFDVLELKFGDIPSINITNYSSLYRKNITVDVHYISQSNLISYYKIIKKFNLNDESIIELVNREILTPVMLRADVYFYKHQIKQIEYILFHGKDHWK